MPNGDPTPCTVRPPVPRDYDRMAELAGQLGYPCTAEVLAGRLGQMGDASHYAVYVAETPGGPILGWIGAYMFRAVEIDKFAEINGLVVAQEARSRGVGEQLLQAAEAWARSQGCDVLSVRANVTRDRAHRFYENHGFQHVKTQKAFCKNL